ncbi:MAG: hypothetical protein RL220_869, partial [Bacteroidota bacterium]
DVGVVAYADVPSRRYCSPTKVGNYLMCGLPFMVQEGTSEDDILVNQSATGLVVRDFLPESAAEVASGIRQLMSRDRAKLREICRQVGLENRGNQRTVEVLRPIFEAYSENRK